VRAGGKRKAFSWFVMEVNICQVLSFILTLCYQVRNFTLTATFDKIGIIDFFQYTVKGKRKGK
jgi:hypothetical protein